MPLGRVVRIRLHRTRSAAIAQEPFRLLSSQLVEEAAYIDMERAGEGVDVLEADVALATLDRADVGSMKIRPLSKGLLRKAIGQTKFADVGPEGETKRTPVSETAHSKLRGLPTVSPTDYK